MTPTQQLEEKQKRRHEYLKQVSIPIDGEFDERYVTAIAHQIRKYYIEEKQKLLKKKFNPSRRHDKAHIWQNAARNCLKLETDPKTFIRAAFQNCELRSGPFSNNLGGAAARKWYKMFIRKMEEDGVKQQDTETPIESVERQTLEEDILAARRTLKRINNTYLVNNTNLDLLSSSISPIAPHIRFLLAYPHKLIIEKDPQGKNAARNFFYTHPGIIKAAKKLGFPMNDILEWLD